MFKERLNALLHNLRNGKYFGDGRIAYMMWVIEYQHRGLPHAHIVFQMDSQVMEQLGGVLLTNIVYPSLLLSAEDFS